MSSSSRLYTLDAEIEIKKIPLMVSSKIIMSKSPVWGEAQVSCSTPSRQWLPSPHHTGAPIKAPIEAPILVLLGVEKAHMSSFRIMSIKTVTRPRPVRSASSGDSSTTLSLPRPSLGRLPGPLARDDSASRLCACYSRDRFRDPWSQTT